MKFFDDVTIKKIIWEKGGGSDNCDVKDYPLDFVMVFLFKNDDSLKLQEFLVLELKYLQNTRYLHTYTLMSYNLKYIII